MRGWATAARVFMGARHIEAVTIHGRRYTRLSMELALAIFAGLIMLSVSLFY